MKDFLILNMGIVSTLAGSVCSFLIALILTIIRHYKFNKDSIGNQEDIQDDNSSNQSINSTIPINISVDSHDDRRISSPTYIVGNGNKVENHNSSSNSLHPAIAIFMVLMLAIAIICTVLLYKNLSQETPIPTEEPAVTQEEKDKHEIDELFARYTNGFVNAVNYKDFSYVEQTMIEGSPIYNKIKDYVLTYCKQKDVHETLVEQKINIYTPNGDDSYYINTFEVYDIQTNESEQVNRRTFNAQYIVKKENGEWYMSEYPIEHVRYN